MSASTAKQSKKMLFFNQRHRDARCNVVCLPLLFVLVLQLEGQNGGEPGGVLGLSSASASSSSFLPHQADQDGPASSSTSSPSFASRAPESGARASAPASFIPSSESISTAILETADISFQMATTGEVLITFRAVPVQSVSWTAVREAFYEAMIMMRSILVIEDLTRLSERSAFCDYREHAKAFIFLQENRGLRDSQVRFLQELLVAREVDFAAFYQFAKRGIVPSNLKSGTRKGRRRGGGEQSTSSREREAHVSQEDCKTGTFLELPRTQKMRRHQDDQDHDDDMLITQSRRQRPREHHHQYLDKNDSYHRISSQKDHDKPIRGDPDFFLFEPLILPELNLPSGARRGVLAGVIPEREQAVEDAHRDFHTTGAEERQAAREFYERFYTVMKFYLEQMDLEIQTETEERWGLQGLGPGHEVTALRRIFISDCEYALEGMLRHKVRWDYYARSDFIVGGELLPTDGRSCSTRRASGGRSAWSDSEGGTSGSEQDDVTGSPRVNEVQTPRPRSGGGTRTTSNNMISMKKGTMFPGLVEEIFYNHGSKPLGQTDVFLKHITHEEKNEGRRNLLTIQVVKRKLNLPLTAKIHVERFLTLTLLRGANSHYFGNSGRETGLGTGLFFPFLQDIEFLRQASYSYPVNVMKFLSLLLQVQLDGGDVSAALERQAKNRSKVRGEQNSERTVHLKRGKKPSLLSLSNQGRKIDSIARLLTSPSTASSSSSSSSAQVPSSSIAYCSDGGLVSSSTRAKYSFTQRLRYFVTHQQMHQLDRKFAYRTVYTRGSALKYVALRFRADPVLTRMACAWRVNGDPDAAKYALPAIRLPPDVDVPSPPVNKEKVNKEKMHTPSQQSMLLRAGSSLSSESSSSSGSSNSMLLSRGGGRGGPAARSDAGAASGAVAGAVSAGIRSDEMDHLNKNERNHSSDEDLILDAQETANEEATSWDRRQCLNCALCCGIFAVAEPPDGAGSAAAEQDGGARDDEKDEQGALVAPDEVDLTAEEHERDNPHARHTFREPAALDRQVWSHLFLSPEQQHAFLNKNSSTNNSNMVKGREEVDTKMQEDASLRSRRNSRSEDARSSGENDSRLGQRMLWKLRSCFGITPADKWKKEVLGKAL